jgi:SH3-like domain-containing protein
MFRSFTNPILQVISVDKNAAYPAGVAVLKSLGTLPRRVRLRQCEFSARLGPFRERSVE